MKFNLKNRLSEMGLIKEGWYHDLQRGDDFDISNLDFVKNLITKVYSKNNYTSKHSIENNPFGEWMVSAIKSLGGVSNLDTKTLKSVQHAFDIILRYFILSEEDDSIVREITSKDPKKAYTYAKEKIDKLDKKFTIPSEIQNWIDSGFIKLVPSGTVDTDRFWIEVLRRDFFDISCESGGKYGIACQQAGQGGGKFVGGKYKTFTLLGTEKNPRNRAYQTLMSVAIDTGENKIIELKQIGNQQPGSTSAKGWTDLGEVAVDFIIRNPEMTNIVKFVDFFTMNVPSQCGTYGGAGALCFFMKNKLNLFEKLVSAKPDILDFHENLIINSLGREYLDDIDVDLYSLYRENPKRFISRIGVYISSSKEEVLDILKNKFNFQEFIQNHGERDIFSVLDTIIESVDFNQFMDSVYPFINFDNFIKNSTEDKIRDVIKELRNKENSPKKALKIIDFLFDSHKESLLEKFGGGTKGFAKIIKIFNTPRLEKHQNFERKPRTNDIYATVIEPRRDESGRVVEDPNNPGNPILEPTSKLVQPEHLILDPTNIRKFLKNNEEEIKSILTGNNMEKEMKFQKYLIIHSSAQDRNKILSKLKEPYIEYYQKKYDDGEITQPGIIKYSMFKEQFYDLVDSSLSKKFVGNPKLHKFEKEDLKDVKYLQVLIKHYIKISEANGQAKLADAIGIILEHLSNSGFSPEEVKNYAFNKLTLEKVLKSSQIKYNIHMRYINNLLEIANEVGISKKDILEYLNSDLVRNSFENASDVTAERKRKNLVDKIEDSQLQESKVRRYISNLLESNYKKKS